MGSLPVGVANSLAAAMATLAGCDYHNFRTRHYLGKNGAGNSAAWTFGKRFDMSTSAQPLAFAAALSTQLDTSLAAAEACAAALKSLGATPDLAVVFFSREHSAKADALAQQLCDALGTENVLGCSGESIVGVGQEVEEGPALSIWLAKWPGVTTHLLNLNFERTAEGGVIQGWPDDLVGEWPEGSFLMLLGEPYSFPADALLERLNEDRPGVAVVGGMASGGQLPVRIDLSLAARVSPKEPRPLSSAVRSACGPSSRKAAARLAGTSSLPRQNGTLSMNSAANRL